MSATLLVALVGLGLIAAGLTVAGLAAWVGFTRDTHGTLGRKGRRALGVVVTLGTLAALFGAALTIGATAVAALEGLGY